MDIFTPVLDWLKNNRKPETITVEQDGVKTTVLVLPNGLSAEPASKFTSALLTKPRRKTGTVTVDTLDSFNAFVKDHKETSSAIFARGATGAMVAVLNFHGKDGDAQRFGDLRCAYTPVQSKPWDAWTGCAGMALDVPEFAEFIDENIVDIAEPPAKNSEDAGDRSLLDLAKLFSTTFADKSEIIKLSRGLRVHVKDAVETVVNTASGEGQIEFKSEHQDRDGKGLTVPGLFCICIPVFERGRLYRLPCRLKYRVNGGRVTFTYEVVNADRAKEHAITEMTDSARTATELPLFFGAAPDAIKAA